MSSKLNIASEFVSSRYHIYSTCSCAEKINKNFFLEYMNFFTRCMKNDARNTFRYKNAGKTVDIKP